MNKNNITCGIHYSALHENSIYNSSTNLVLPKSSQESKQTVSIPFHENLSINGQLNYIIDKIKKYE
jgi:dTDP-4-amino-4,6-dideoxygalactose transaminase